MRKEPIAITALISTTLSGIIPVLLLFGVIDWTSDQIAAILLAVNSVTIAIAAVVSRSVVYSPNTVNGLFFSEGEPSHSPADQNAYLEGQAPYNQ